jgi:hypothetical protein
MFCCARLSLALFGLASAKAGESAPTPKVPPWAAEKILPPEPGRKACFQRVYDAKDLQAHPQQKVTELLFFCVFRAMTPAEITFSISQITFSTTSPFR